MAQRAGRGGCSSREKHSSDRNVQHRGLNSTAGGLVFIGATDDSRFRAFDKDTGKELWTVRVPASAHATPMTFFSNKTKKQYVVIAAGGGNKYNDIFSDSLVAWSLP